jgi:hypothetical protein
VAAATLKLASRSRSELVSWILSFGDTGEVLSPAWLREEVPQKVAALAARYATARNDKKYVGLREGYDRFLSLRVTFDQKQ